DAGGTAPMSARPRPLAALAPLLGAVPALGQESAPTRVDPVPVRPFQLQLQCDHLFGDWGGVRTGLEDAGIKPTLTLVTDFAWNPTGGRDQGATEASNLGLDVVFDLDKIFGLKGGTFLAQISERWGSSLTNEYIGNVFNVQQVFGGETFRMVDMAW